MRSSSAQYSARCVALGLSWTLDHGIHRAGVGRVGGGPVGPDAQFAQRSIPGRPDRLLDELLDFGHRLLGLLDAGAGLGTDVDFEGAGIDLGKELAAQVRAQAAPRPARSSPAAPSTVAAVLQHAIELARVPVDAGVDPALIRRQTAGDRQRRPAPARAGRCGLSQAAARLGTNDMASTKAEIIAKATARASGLNRNWPLPGIMPSGASTSSVAHGRHQLAA